MLPAGHELAAREIVKLSELAALPLHLVPRKLNPPLVDLVLTACADAGFTPPLAPHVEGLDNTHAVIAAGAPSWTVIYEAHARALHHPHVAFRPTDPELVMPTELAVAADATSRAVAPLLRACSAAGTAARLGSISDRDRCKYAIASRSVRLCGLAWRTAAADRPPPQP